MIRPAYKLLAVFLYSQVEGFPSPDEVRTFYVEHDIDGSEEDTSVLDFILSDKRIQGSKEESIETLASVGFSDERQKLPIGSPSGGWKMKLALARAMLFKADILLLDEPTNHLGVVNIAWLENYLIIPFFEMYPLVGIKQNDFLDWCKVAKLMSNKSHLTIEGLNLIRTIKGGMNKGRPKE